jgi:hypothetical protein
MTTYSLMDELLASPTEPLPLKKREWQLGRMREALENCKVKSEPKDAQVLSTAIDLMVTLQDRGYLEDAENALEDGMVALMQPNLNDIEVRTFEGILEDYQMVMENLPARTMIAAHRATEKRLGKRKVAA